MGLLLVTLGVATAGWLVHGRRAGLALAALTVGGLGVLGALASATLGPVAADRAWTTAVLALTGLLAIGGGGPVTTAVFRLVDRSHAGEARR